MCSYHFCDQSFYGYPQKYYCHYYRLHHHQSSSSGYSTAQNNVGLSYENGTGKSKALFMFIVFLFIV